MSDPFDVPPEHLWITRLIALGMARADEEGTAFHRGGHPDATEADRTLHREYLEEAYEVLRGTGRIDELSLIRNRGKPRTSVRGRIAKGRSDGALRLDRPPLSA